MPLRPTPSDSPGLLRAAAYLRVRQDKTADGRIRCNAPNRRCGNRCIPPAWDCRLKGEGDDPHLKAVSKGSDPVAGFANIERGIGRIGKGATKLSFSEIEGGRRAIARGAAKLAPGDLKQKQKVRETVDGFFRVAGAPIAVAVFGALTHRGLKAFPAYRNGYGRQIDDAAREAMFAFRRNVPLFGRSFRAREGAGISAVRGAETAFSNLAQRGPGSLSANASQRASLQAIAAGARDTRTAGRGEYEIDNSLRRANRLSTNTERPSKLPYDEWAPQSLTDFWSTRRSARVTPAGVTPEGNLFSLHATNNLFADSYNIRRVPGAELKAEGNQIIAALSDDLNRRGTAIRSSMRLLGMDANQPAQVRAYLARNRALRASGLPEDYNTQLQATLVNAVTRTDYRTQATQLYANTVRGYDQFFNSVVEDIKTAPSISVGGVRGTAGPNLAAQERRRNSFFSDARQAHAQYLGAQINLPEGVHGPGTATLVRKAYHGRMVEADRRSNNAVNVVLTPTEATTAATELAQARGLPTPTTAPEAINLLTQHYGATGSARTSGLGSISINRPVAAGYSRQRPSTPGAEPRAARRRVRSESQIVADLLKVKTRDANGRQVPAYSREAAIAEAKRIIAARRRDEARADAYRATQARLRQDFQEGTGGPGKPCGASHIPKRHNCTKGAGQAEAPAPRKGPSPGAIAAVVAAGAVAVTGLHVARDMQRVAKLPASFAPSPSNRTLIRDVKKEMGVKASAEAMGRYYTEKSGLKPGDVVYYRTAKDPAAHFGVYLGPGKDGKVRAVMANPHKTRGSVVDTFEIGTTKAGSNDAAHFLVPTLVKAPPLKGATRLSNEETVRRALRVAGSDYNFALTKDNCEALANSIAYNTPRSQQLERFSKVTQVVADRTIGTRQRAAAQVVRLRHRTRPKGGVHTAGSLITKLSKDDQTFLSPEGKKLATEYYSQFFGRLDALDTQATLQTPVQFWNQIKDYPQAHQVALLRDYLLLVRLSREVEAPRTDAKGVTKGKKCGNSYISKTYECDPDKKGSKTAAVVGTVAAVAGAAAVLAYGAKRAKLNEFHLGGGVRKRRLDFMEKNSPATMSTDISNALGTLKGQKGVINDNVKTIQDFVGDRGIISDPASLWRDVEESMEVELSHIIGPEQRKQLIRGVKLPITLGATDGLAISTSNNLFVRSTRKDINKLQADPANVVQTVNKFMDLRAAHPDKPPQAMREGLYAVSMSAKDGDTRELLTFIHEIAHKAHYQASLNDRISYDRMLRGQLFEPPTPSNPNSKYTGFMDVVETIQKDKARRAAVLRPAASEYGRSDLMKDRAETFAELSVLYVTQGERFKREYPGAYDWTDAIWKKARAKT